MAPEVAEAEAVRGVGAVISRETVRLYLRTFGRGPTKARTYIHSDYAVCVLRDVFTTGERSLVASGGREQVEGARQKISDAIEDEFIGLVERETGRPVQIHLTQIKVPANLAVHFFLFDDADVGSSRAAA